MKRKICFCLLASVLLVACGARKRVTQGIDYTHPQVGRTYYEFPTYALDNPSVLDGIQTTEILPGEDEDFTSENMTTSYGNYGDVVITVATHKFKLGNTASRREMALFQQAMDKAYSVALRQYRPSGFTYSLSSVGAVNPLSDLEVTCKMSENSANAVGQASCRTFFNNVVNYYRQSIAQ